MEGILVGLRMVRVLALALPAFAALSGASCKKAEDSIKIGFIGPLTIRNALFGTECVNGMNIALDEINQSGGVLGKKMELVVYDDQSLPAKTLGAFNEMTLKEHISFVVGSLTSICTEPLVPLANARQVILLTPSSTADALTEAGSFVFRTCYTDEFQGMAGARFARQYLDLRRAAVFYNRSNPYSVGLNESFIKNYVSMGGTICFDESFTSDDVDFRAQINRIKTCAPDMVYLPDDYAVVAFIVKELRSRGVHVPIIGGDAWDGIAYKAGSEMLNSYYSAHYAPDSNDAKISAFVEKYREEYGGAEKAFSGTPISHAALGYDSLYLLRDAITHAGTLKPAEVRNALAKLHGSYLMGDYQFDSNNNPQKPVYILELVRKSPSGITTRYRAKVSP